eukprot:m.86252 g.86252  ORF g.86252 m.86252 type:complete len:759 (+) comp13049_c1_seq1:108-2384(+)
MIYSRTKMADSLLFFVSKLLLLCAHVNGDFAFGVPFTDDAVLQRGVKASIYGIVDADITTVTVSVIDEATGQSVTAVPASILPSSAAGGTANPLCQQRCIDAGHCCQGSISSCQKPSCAMGCILAGRTKGVAECKAQCANIENSKQCSYSVVSPASPFHNPGETTQNQSIQMCSNCPMLSNGTQCGACGQEECTAGCEFGSPDVQPKAPNAWKAVLAPMTAGGSYTIEAKTPNTVISISRVTYGDVFICSGQSNMALAINHTFSKPALDAKISSGIYHNIRIFQYGDMGTMYQEIEPAYVTTTGTLHEVIPTSGTWGNMTAATTPRTKGDPTFTLFNLFSATCFYFGQALTDERKEETPVPIGLIQTAIGGSQIEAWMPDSALAECKNESLNSNGQSPPARLFNGMIAPFVNYSVQGFLWYQGENNVGGDPGNSDNNTGYGCEMVSMIKSWRQFFSAEPGTTASDAPFGLVSLAAGGSEGHDTNMAAFRWSQTGNYGELPNQAMPNTFLAHAYDMGDPMDNLRPPCSASNSWGPSPTNKSAFGPSGPCIWPPASAWNKAVLPLRDIVFQNMAPSFMGGIHPRFKYEVGRRLALAYMGVESPTLSGCSMSDGKLELQFKNLDYDDLLLQWNVSDYNMSNWNGKDSSSLMVCAGEGATSSDCASNMSLWQAAPLLPGSSKSLMVQISMISSPILAIRYGWPMMTGADTCCPNNLVAKGRKPCVPASCPIITSNNSLPANPFFAEIVNGKCQCLKPQDCSS